jgi:hypothetical protein
LISTDATNQISAVGGAGGVASVGLVSASGGVTASASATAIDSLAKRHSVSPAAVQVVMTALRSGGGRMARFSHADFGGMSQWSPGMSIVGDMFNAQLKAKLDALCKDIATHLATNDVASPSYS